MRKSLPILGLIAAAVIAATAGSASAVSVPANALSIDVYRITSSDAPDVGAKINIDYWSDTYTDKNGVVQNGVYFNFSVDGSTSSIPQFSITEIYFQDGTWLNPPPEVVEHSTSVTWVTNATEPPALPGGANKFVTDAALSSQSQQQEGQPANGINPGEYLQLFFAYMPGTSTVGDVSNAFSLYNGSIDYPLTKVNGIKIADPLDGMAIGLHVTGFTDGLSDSYVTQYGVNHDITPVPLPASAGVGLSMLAGFGDMFGLRKKLRRSLRIA